MMGILCFVVLQRAGGNRSRNGNGRAEVQGLNYLGRRGFSWFLGYVPRGPVSFAWTDNDIDRASMCVIIVGSVVDFPNM